jgi:transposase
VICIDARHAGAALQAGFRNKNDRNDARGIADLMGVNKYRPVWVKSPEAQRQGRLLTARATLQSQLVAPREHDPRSAPPRGYWADRQTHRL